MANALKGELELQAGGKTYTLAFTNNAIVQVEEMFGGKGIGLIAAEAAANSRVGDVRTLLWGALVTHHPDVNLISVGGVMDDYDGPLSDIVEKIGRAIRFRLSRVPVEAPLDGDTIN